MQTPKEHSNVRKIIRSRVNESRFKDYNSSPASQIAMIANETSSDRFRNSKYGCGALNISNSTAATMRTSRNAVMMTSRNATALENGHGPKNYISVNNPKVVVQSPQTNTIILFDSQFKGD